MEELDITTKKPRAPTGMFTCCSCGGLFPSETKIIYNNKKYCPSCNKRREKEAAPKFYEDGTMVLPKAPRKTPTSKASKGNFTCKGCGKEFPKEELYKYKAKNFCLECGTKARREDRTKKKEEALTEPIIYKCVGCGNNLDAKRLPFTEVLGKKYCPSCAPEALIEGEAYNNIRDFVQKRYGNYVPAFIAMGQQLKKLVSNKQMKCSYSGIYRTLIYVFITHDKEFHLTFRVESFYNIVLDNYYKADQEYRELQKVKERNKDKDGYKINNVEVRINADFLEQKRLEILQKRKNIELGPKIGLENLNIDMDDEEIQREKEEIIASFGGNYDEECFLIGI